jgi:hypothetical protein
MQYGYCVFPENKLVVQKFTGSISFAEIKAAAEKLYSDPAFNSQFDRITDIREASIEMSREELRDFGMKIIEQDQDSHAKRAMLVADIKDTALALIYEKMVTIGQSLKVFSTTSAVCQWIGLEVDFVEDIIDGIQLEEN